MFWENDRLYMIKLHQIYHVFLSFWIYLVQFSHSVVSRSLQPHGLQHARLACLPITKSQSLLKLMSVKLVMPSNHHILCRSLLLMPSIFPSIRVFSNESIPHIRWPKCWSFKFNITTSNVYSGLISSEWTSWILLQSKGLSRVFF